MESQMLRPCMNCGGLLFDYEDDWCKACAENAAQNAAEEMQGFE